MLNELSGFQLGPIFIVNSILSIIVSVLIAYYIFLHLIKRTSNEESDPILNVIQTSGVLFLLTFKILPFLLHPSYLFTPSKLLLYSGGPFALEISALVAILYFGFYYIKQKWSLIIIDHLAIAIYVFLISNSILLKKYGARSPLNVGYLHNEVLYHPVNVYYALLYLLIGGSIVTFALKQKQGVKAILLCIAFFFIETLISPFK